MINPLTDELFPVTESGDVLQMRHHPSTYVRWYLRGIRNVKLETVLIGGKRYTTRQALEQFFAATTKTSAAVQSDSRQKRIEVAERELSGKRDTTRQALEQFFAAASSKASIAEQSDSRQKSIEAAERELNSR